MDRLTIYKSNKYSLGFRGELIDLYSLNELKYPNIIGLAKSEIENAFKTNIWVRVRGCNALYDGIVDGFVILDVRLSVDVQILEAKEVDRGIYQAKLPVSEVEEIWEERLPYLDFPFPEGLEKKVVLDKSKLLK